MCTLPAFHKEIDLTSHLLVCLLEAFGFYVLGNFLAHANLCATLSMLSPFEADSCRAITIKISWAFHPIQQALFGVSFTSYLRHYYSTLEAVVVLVEIEGAPVSSFFFRLTEG